MKIADIRDPIGDRGGTASQGDGLPLNLSLCTKELVLFIHHSHKDTHVAPHLVAQGRARAPHGSFFVASKLAEGPCIASIL